MGKTLTELRALVASDLADAGNALWSTDELDRAIRKALYAYSWVRPREAEATIEAADGREYDLTGLAGLMDVQRVWWPYEAGEEPRWQPFEVWGNGRVLFLRSAEQPKTGDGPLRVFYGAVQTMGGLDGAAESTYPDEDEETLVLGATAYAAVQRARYVVENVNPSADTPDDWAEWGRARLREFERALWEIARVGNTARGAWVTVELEV